MKPALKKFFQAKQDWKNLAAKAGERRRKEQEAIAAATTAGNDKRKAQAAGDERD